MRDISNNRLNKIKARAAVYYEYKPSSVNRMKVYQLIKTSLQYKHPNF